MFARHVQPVGVVTQLAMCAELALLEQLQETLHQDCRRRGDCLVAIERGVEIKEVDDHSLHGVQQHIPIE